VHPADHDLVIAAGQAVLHRALQHGQDSLQPRAAGRPGPVAHPVPDRGQAAAGEVGRQVLLRRGQDVDHERAVPVDGPQRQAAEVEADQHQRRLERQRRDRARRGPHRLAFFVNRRHDGHARGEMAHRPPELSFADPGRRFFHGSHRAKSYHIDE